jgi:hypothetical protein
LRYETRAELWASGGKGAWHFLTLPPDLAAGIKAMAGGLRPWGSVRVEASIGETRWRTSLFADSKTGTFFLPVKADIRAKAGINAGDVVDVTVEVEL